MLIRKLKTMSTESLNSSATSSSFTGGIDNYLDKIGSKAPQSWRKPRSRMYDYNRTLGNEYYQVKITGWEDRILETFTKYKGVCLESLKDNYH